MRRPSLLYIFRKLFNVWLITRRQLDSHNHFYIRSSSVGGFVWSLCRQSTLTVGSFLHQNLTRHSFSHAVIVWKWKLTGHTFCSVIFRMPVKSRSLNHRFLSVVLLRKDGALQEDTTSAPCNSVTVCLPRDQPRTTGATREFYVCLVSRDRPWDRCELRSRGTKTNTYCFIRVCQSDPGTHRPTWREEHRAHQDHGRCRLDATRPAAVPLAPCALSVHGLCRC